MKRNNYQLILIAGLLVFFVSSCKKSFFTSVNENPNVVATVKPPLLLSTVEAALAYTQGGDISRYTSLITQQVFGANSQSQSYYNYGFNAGAFDNLWPDLYTSTMENDYSLMHISDAGKYNEYSGISRILMAYTLQVAVDLWGKVPYSQAFKGNLTDQNLHPTFDDDKALYDTIASLVNVGINYLNDPDPGILTPGSEDVIYNGVAAKWIKFGHAIKARLYIHQSKGNPAMATQALAEIALSFTSSAQNARYVFGTAETAANPWYQFNRDRPGDETFSNSTMMKNLLALNDPRYSIFVDNTNDGKKKKGNHYGGLNDYYGSVNSPVEFITYDELLFVSAEATLRTSGNIASAQALYQMAIKENMTKLGVAPAAITTYIGANGTLPAGVDAAIAKVASQEFIALYLNPEAWTLWRRTNSPALTPISGTNGIPRRLLYPQSEYSYNAANVPVPAASNTLWSPRIFWDK